MQALEKGWLARGQRIRDKEVRAQRESLRMQRLSERRASVDSRRSTVSVGSTGSEHEDQPEFQLGLKPPRSKPKSRSRRGSVELLMTRALSLIPRRMSAGRVEPDQ